MEVAEVLPEFADAFAFEEFNRMQREALPALLESEENVVASAPTARGRRRLRNWRSARRSPTAARRCLSLRCER